MRIVIHHSSHYDWEPVPTGTTVTEQDIAAKRVKPGANGAWLMRVPKVMDSHTTVDLPEAQIIANTIDDLVKHRLPKTRHELIADYLAAHVMPHHAHPKWFTNVEVEGDGPDEALFRSIVGRHVAAGNIEAADVEDAVAAYLHDGGSHAEHLRRHFKIKAVS